MNTKPSSTITPAIPAGPRAGTTRVPLKDSGPLVRAVSWWSRRTYGKELEPVLALLHNRRVAIAVSRFELAVGKWNRLDRNLSELVCLRVASQIGCSWCMDFGYYLSRTNGMAPEKLEEVARWRVSELYTPLERRALEYAEAMTATPPTVTDVMVEVLRGDLGDAALVELTEMIAVENLRSRTNAALGLTSQGFKDQCELR